MSLENILQLKPSEVKILEWVRSYEFLENSYGLDVSVPQYVEIKCTAAGVQIRKNGILAFPEYEVVNEEIHDTVEDALVILKQWAEEILGTIDLSIN